MRILVKREQKVYALVDKEDYQEVKKIKWYSVGRLGYARNKAGKTLHRFVTKALPGEIIDHINGNPLDNRKANLRRVDMTQSHINTKFRYNETGHRGIRKSLKKFRPYVSVNKKQVYLGVFGTLQGAWLARRWGERLHYGEYALFRSRKGVTNE